MSAPVSVRLRLALESFRENLTLVLRTWSGKVGVALLLIQLILALYTLAVYFPTGVAGKYTRSTEWVYYYPRAAPPCWATQEKVDMFKVTENDFSSTTNVSKKTITIGFGVAKYSVYTIKTNYTAQFTYDSNVFPQDLKLLIDLYVKETINASTIRGANVPPKLKIEISIVRPDGLRALLFNGSIPRQLFNSEIIMAGDNVSGKILPFRLGEQAERVGSAVYVNPDLIVQNLQVVLEQINPNKTESLREKPAKLLMTKAGPTGEPEVLKGTYTIIITVTEVMDGKYYENGYRINVTLKKFILEPIPNCHGILGTDTMARPIGLGLLLGIPYAFLLGFIVTFTSTFIGAIYGTLAGYWKDYRGEAMMRVADVFLSLPFLPILIALSYVLGSINLWMLSFLMIVLFWAGPVIVIRSMALQISEQPYVEAAKAVGASTWRIVFRHIFPQVFPYTLAIAVLSIPGIIIAEASLSLLGLGDPTAPTWGKMLEEAYASQAVQNGLWWMYLFPGLALVVFSATFLLIGRAVEPLVAPKLQR